MYRVCTSLRLKSVLLLGMQCHSLLKLFALSSWDFVARRCTHVRQPFTSEGARWSQPWRHGLFWICISLVCSRTFRTALAARLLQRLRRETRRGDRALAVVEARFSDDSLIRSVCLDDSYSFVSVLKVFIHFVGGRIRCNGLLYLFFLISLAVANQSLSLCL